MVAVGMGLENIHEPGWVPYLGKALSMIAVLFLGYSAADKGGK
jgi:hypothetical protein